MTTPPNVFSWPDIVVFTLVLLVSASIGIYYGCTGGKQKTTQEFLMADRAMSILPVALSLLASFMSAITLLGTPAEMYIYGTQYWLIWVGYALLIPIAAHVFLPVFYNLKVTSVFEYLEMRFGRTVRICGAIVFIIQMVLYMAIVLYAPSLALNAVTGLNVWISVFSVGIVCTFYTTLGGMKAVMWTDTFQIICMFAGLLAVLIQGSIELGGFGKIWQAMVDGGRIEFFDMDPTPLKRHTFWSVTVGGCFTWLAVYGTNQAQVQRAIAVPKLRHGQIALWINLFGLTALLTICSLCGFVIYAQYKDCDPLSSGAIDASDQLLPYYVMDRLSHLKGLPGLLTASLFSGALSTISSGLNSLSAVTLQDIVRVMCAPNITEERATQVSKVLAVCYGVICIALTFVAANLGGVLQAALGLFGMLGGPLLGVFMLGMLYPCANNKGAITGFLSGVIFCLWLGIGAQVYKPPVWKATVSTAGCPAYNMTTVLPPDTTDLNMLPYITSPPDQDNDVMPGYSDFYKVSYIWYSTVAVTVVSVVGLAVSCMTGCNQPGEVDPKLLSPIFDICCPYLPQRSRNILRCHVDYDKEWDEEPNRPESVKDGHTNNGFISNQTDKDVEATQF